MRIRLLLGSAALAATTLGASVAARDPADRPVPAESSFVALDEIAVPIAGTQQVEGSLRATIVVETAPDHAGAVTARLPEVRAAAVSGMIEFSRLYATGLTAVDAERLRADMTAALREVDPAVGDVLITEVSATRA